MFKVTVSKNRVRICLSAELVNVEKVDMETKLFLTDGGFDDIAFGACLVMRELVNNSIIHGSKENPRKRIRYCLEKREDGFEMSIEDEGEGFDWEAAMETVPSLSASHGRGMMILNAYCHDVRFNEKGNRISVKFVKEPV
ncbi:MAG: ATP-binding protein [Planctomycetota bacterium]